MNIQKHGNKWRITQSVNGVRYRVSVDHKPTASEAVKLMAQQIENNSVSETMKFSRACEAYLESKNNVVSVTTIKGYRVIMRAISPSFMNTGINMITLPMFQTEINSYSANHSPKSVRNMSGFITSVLKYYGVSLGTVKLPQREKKEVYIPSIDEIKTIFNYLKGNKYELPIMLAGMGLRRSEICALTPGDLNGNKLTINKAKVQDLNNEWVIKSTKTTESTRTIVLPDYIVELIHKQGFYDGHPELIYRELQKACVECGIKPFPLHKMRHFFASYMHDLGFSDKQIQSMGGWQTDAVMKTVYIHEMEMDKAKAEMANQFNNLLG